MQTEHHYYDTFAFVDDQWRLHWPNCIFSNCTKCQALVAADIRIAPEGLLTVSSAFGGLALIKAGILADPSIRWKPPEGTPYTLCEHIGFCAALQSRTDLTIAIACDAKVFWNAETFGKT